MHPEEVIIAPLVTEKSIGGRALARYAFKVNPLATKIAVKLAVEHLFRVKVQDVNTLKVKPKKKVTGHSIGRTSQWKKAYVTLRAGQKIEELEV